MSKEQKTLKSCYILDRLREWFELYGNQNHQRAEEELHLAIDELYEYQQKDRQIADLESRLAESEKDKQFYFFENGEKGLKIRELKQQLAEKEEALKYYETLLKRQCNECKDQDKISFAIAELEKVKDYAQHIQGGLINYIDNQINELKELK